MRIVIGITIGTTAAERLSMGRALRPGPYSARFANQAAFADSAFLPGQYSFSLPALPVELRI